VENVKNVEEVIVAEIKNNQEKCMSFDEIIEKLYNPEPAYSIPNIVFALNKLVKRGLLRQFRATHCGRIQNHYRLVE